LSSVAPPAEASFAQMQWRGAAHLYALSLRRQFWSRQTIVCTALVALLGTIVFVWGLQRNPTAKKFAEQVLSTGYIGFLIPIFGISYGASAIGGEREDRTLIYLLITPIIKPLGYGAKALATMTLVFGWTLGSLLVFCAMVNKPGWEIFPIFVWSSLLGAAAYTAIFMFFGTAFRYGTIISLAYWFFLEGLFGNMPGTIKRITVSFYMKSWVYDLGSNLRLGPLGRGAKESFLAVSGETAMFALLGLTAITLAVGAYLFDRREFAELG
jgi:ABC-2 type transport system permease protein